MNKLGHNVYNDRNAQYNMKVYKKCMRAAPFADFLMDT